MALPVTERQITTTNGDATIVAEVLAPDDPIGTVVMLPSLSRGS